MIALPTVKTKPQDQLPRLEIIYGRAKTGKSTIFCAAPDTLVLDTQDGVRFYESTSIPVKTLADMREVLAALQEYQKTNGKNLYKRIVIDVATDMVEMVLPFALQKYQKTPMAFRKDGTIYTGDILNLPRGAGYKYLREAFEEVYESFYPYCDTVILVCHEKEISKYGDDVSDEMVLVPDLPGKMMQRNTGWADAIGHVTRKENQTIINFKSNGDITKGSRDPMLQEKEIVIMESGADGKISDIYLSRLFRDCEDIKVNNTEKDNGEVRK